MKTVASRLPSAVVRNDGAPLVAALLLLGGAPGAFGQPAGASGAGGPAVPPVQIQWSARQFQPGVNAIDEGRDIAAFPRQDSQLPVQWVCATG